MNKKILVLALPLCLALPAFAAPTEATSLTWDAIRDGRLTGYKVYCATDGRHANATPRAVTSPNMSFAGFPDGIYDCRVTSVSAAGESQFSEVSVPKVECKAGKCYPLDVLTRPSPPAMCAVDAVKYVVVRNTSRADGSRPLQRLKDPAQPYSSTNPLVPLSPAAYVLPDTACDALPLVNKTTAGYWLYTTNAAGTRGVALCQAQ